MVVYEITAAVEPQLVESYEEYMRERHIPDLLATGYFFDADFNALGENRYQIRYKAQTQANLDEYLRTQAERLRADFSSHFPAGVELSRRIFVE